MRRLYTSLLYLAAPLALARLALRGLRAPAYWRGWGQRFGRYPPGVGQPAIWVHAVSVGEVQAAAPLVRSLLRDHPRHRLLVTTTTPTGADQARKLFGDQIQCQYLPYDLPGAVARFLDRFTPVIGLIMETEIWPNLYHACAARGLPLFMVNARMSPTSARGYRRVAGLTRATLGQVAGIAAQTEEDARRLIDLGAPPDRVQVTGNTKFDLQPPASLHEEAAVLRRELGLSRPVWVAASTHEGEEERLLAAHDRLRRSLPSALLVLVPRHPERFHRAEVLCRHQGLEYVLRSARIPVPADVPVFIGDSMGELGLFYAAADIAFLGGSLVPVGGHNPLEAAALGRPVIFGPHMFNFAEIARLLLVAGAARRIQDAADLAPLLETWFADPSLRHDMGERGATTVAANRGARDRVLAMIRGSLPPGPA